MTTSSAATTTPMQCRWTSSPAPGCRLRPRWPGSRSRATVGVEVVFLQSFVRLNGRAVASNVVNRWPEDNHRTASSGSMTRDHRTSDIVPVWASLEEDDYFYGFDDDGDVNRFDRNTAVSFGYVPWTGDYARGHRRASPAAWACKTARRASSASGCRRSRSSRRPRCRSSPRRHRRRRLRPRRTTCQTSRPRPSTRRRSPSRTRVPAPPARSPSARRVTCR